MTNISLDTNESAIVFRSNGEIELSVPGENQDAAITDHVLRSIAVAALIQSNPPPFQRMIEIMTATIVQEANNQAATPS